MDEHLTVKYMLTQRLQPLHQTCGVSAQMGLMALIHGRLLGSGDVFGVLCMKKLEHARSSKVKSHHTSLLQNTSSEAKHDMHASLCSKERNTVRSAEFESLFHICRPAIVTHIGTSDHSDSKLWYVV